MLVPPRILYAGPGLSGRRTTLIQLATPKPHVRSPWPPSTDAARLEAGIDVRLVRGSERVQIAMLDAGKYWFDSIASQATSKLPYIRESAERVLAWAPTFTGVVFVMDSQDARLEGNREAVERVGAVVDLDNVRVVFQLNKRDLPRALPVAALRAALARPRAVFVESIATTGLGVREALDAAIRDT